MMATATPLDLQAENRALKDEIAQLKRDLDELGEHSARQLAELRREFNSSQDFFAMQIAGLKKELSEIKREGLMDSSTATKHVDELLSWFDAHPERDGMNNKEAAEVMHVTTARVCQLKPRLALDDRLKITRKHISFA